jgi:hypothetical protein
VSLPNDSKLARLWARQEIKDLPLRYVFCIDTRDLDGFADLWAERDQPAAFPDMDRDTFAGGVDRFFRSSTASVHLVANHLVTFQDDTHATGQVYCWAQTDRTSAWVGQMVLYQDRYVCGDDD